MSARLDYFHAVPEIANALMGMGTVAMKMSIDPVIKSLIAIRASQLNASAFCLDMHIKKARIEGEKEQRIYHLTCWRESSLFNSKEKVALALTDALTILSDTKISRELYQDLRDHFSDFEISELSYSIGLINLWNRMQIFKSPEPYSQYAVFELVGLA